MPHILLVDDNRTFVYAGRELILHHRPTFVVDTAFDAETALSAIRTHDYDVVVSDLVLPRLDGIALLSECREIRPDTLVLLISGFGDVQLERLAAQRGAYAFLHKPVDPDVFFSVVNRTVLRAKMRVNRNKCWATTVGGMRRPLNRPGEVQCRSGTVTQGDSKC
jgi:two-component system, sensor histidine kinase and response regulator